MVAVKFRVVLEISGLDGDRRRSLLIVGIELGVQHAFEGRETIERIAPDGRVVVLNEERIARAVAANPALKTIL